MDYKASYISKKTGKPYKRPPKDLSNAYLGIVDEKGKVRRVFDEKTVKGRTYKAYKANETNLKKIDSLIDKEIYLKNIDEKISQKLSKSTGARYTAVALDAKTGKQILRPKDGQEIQWALKDKKNDTISPIPTKYKETLRDKNGEVMKVYDKKKKKDVYPKIIKENHPRYHKDLKKALDKHLSQFKGGQVVLGWDMAGNMLPPIETDKTGRKLFMRVYNSKGEYVGPQRREAYEHIYKSDLYYKNFRKFTKKDINKFVEVLKPGEGKKFDSIAQLISSLSFPKPKEGMRNSATVKVTWPGGEITINRAMTGSYYDFMNNLKRSIVESISRSGFRFSNLKKLQEFAKEEKGNFSLGKKVATLVPGQGIELKSRADLSQIDKSRISVSVRYEQIPEEYT